MVFINRPLIKFRISKPLYLIFSQLFFANGSVTCQKLFDLKRKQPNSNRVSGVLIGLRTLGERACRLTGYREMFIDALF